MKKIENKNFYIPYRGWFLNTSDAVRSILNENYKLDTKDLEFIFNNILPKEKWKKSCFDNEKDEQLVDSVNFLIKHLSSVGKFYDLGRLRDVLNKDFKYDYLYQTNKETCVLDKDRTANLDKYFVGYYFICNNKETRDLIVSGVEKIKAREELEQAKEREEKFKKSLIGKVCSKLKNDKKEDVNLIDD